MTAYDLFAVASDLRRRAEACERVRMDVDAIWRGLDLLLEGPVARHQPAVWQSEAADASRLRLRHQHTHLIRLRHEVEQVARRLQARADQLFADAAQVEMAAEAALLQEGRELATQAAYFR